MTNWLRKEKKKAIIYDQEIEYSENVMLDYEVTDFSPGRFLWNIRLHTGKYHQIRAQLAHIGCAIIGDKFYGSTISYKKDAIALNASRLMFSHPVTGEEMSIAVASGFR